MTELKDKIVVITGSSAGIGAATAVGFAKHGAKLVITGRNQFALDQVAQRCLENGSPQVESVCTDIATDAGVETLVNATLMKFGTIHILINNAGSDAEGDLRTAKGSADALDFAYQLMLRAPWKLSGFFVDELMKNKGNIVNVSSIWADITIPTSACYCIIKAAVTHMTKCMATELGMQGVRVNCVAPGAVRTNIYRDSGFSEQKIDEMFKTEAECYHLLEQKVISPEEVARAILFLASGSANRITGVSLPVDCGALLSSPAYDFAGSQSIPGLDKK